MSLVQERLLQDLVAYVDYTPDLSYLFGKCIDLALILI